MNPLGSIRSYFQKKNFNSKAGETFDWDAFKHSHFEKLKLYREEEADTHGNPSSEEWTNLTRVKGGVRAHEIANPDEEFLVKQSRGTLRRLGFKVTRKAIEKACEVAEVSNEYMKFAAGYLATERGHEVGRVANDGSVLNALMAVKARFPTLEDVKQGYNRGRQNNMQQRMSNRESSYKLEETYLPHPRMNRRKKVANKGKSSYGDEFENVRLHEYDGDDEDDEHEQCEGESEEEEEEEEEDDLKTVSFEGVDADKYEEEDEEDSMV